MISKNTDFDPLEKQIIDNLNAILSDAKQQGWEWEMGKWTKRIKEDLGNLALKLGYRVACSGFDRATQGEWLYDMVWWQQDGEYMSRIALVLEAEWKPTLPLDDDFFKLMLARADHHVWVFQGDTQNTIGEAIEKCKKHLYKFEALPSGDRFLFAGVSWNPREFSFQLYVRSLK